LRSNAFAQQRNSPHSHSAAFAALFCQVPHTSPEGLRLHITALPHRQPPEHSQQSAFAPSCTACFCRRLTRTRRMAFAAHSTCVAKKAKAPSKA